MSLTPEDVLGGAVLLRKSTNVEGFLMVSASDTEGSVGGEILGGEILGESSVEDCFASLITADGSFITALTDTSLLSTGSTEPDSFSFSSDSPVGFSTLGGFSALGADTDEAGFKEKVNVVVTSFLLVSAGMTVVLLEDDVLFSTLVLDDTLSSNIETRDVIVEGAEVVITSAAVTLVLETLVTGVELPDFDDAVSSISLT